jgi:hypothetical protein
MKLLIDAASVTDSQHRNSSTAIVDFINDPVISHSQAPAVISLELKAASRSRVVAKRGNPCLDGVIERGV